MAKVNLTIIEQMNELKKHHSFALNGLYRAQDHGGYDDNLKLSEDYWRGCLVGLETAMNMLGVEHEEYDPFRKQA